MRVIPDSISARTKEKKNPSKPKTQQTVRAPPAPYSSLPPSPLRRTRAPPRPPSRPSRPPSWATGVSSLGASGALALRSPRCGPCDLPSRCIALQRIRGAPPPVIAKCAAMHIGLCILFRARLLYLLAYNGLNGWNYCSQWFPVVRHPEITHRRPP